MMSSIKMLLYRLTIHNKHMDGFIRAIEYCRGLYRYPKKMLGRKVSHLTHHRQTDVLVFAAHPDDELLGVGTQLIRHKQNGEQVTVTYITNGAGEDGASWKFSKQTSKLIADTRYQEGIHGLSEIDISKEDIFCLGYPDAGTHRYLKHIAQDVLHFIQTMNPKKVYVHCVEAGHSDHDITSFVVKSVCKQIGYTNVYEWAEYNKKQQIGSPNITFNCSRITSLLEVTVHITKQEQRMKKKMLACHKSQQVEGYYKMGEAVRQAHLVDLEEEMFQYSSFTGKRIHALINQFTIYMNSTKAFRHRSNQPKKDDISAPSVEKI